MDAYHNTNHMKSDCIQDVDLDANLLDNQETPMQRQQVSIPLPIHQEGSEIINISNEW